MDHDSTPLNGNYELVYIAGYGRSGSTLLEKILDAHPDMFGVGELSYLPEEVLDPQSRCSCGATPGECIFWQPILASVLAQTGETWQDLYLLQRQAEASGIYKGRGVYAKPENWQERYARYLKVLYGNIARALPVARPIIVDSSKTSYTSIHKPGNLITMELAPIKIIHLVRDLRGVIWSMASRGLNRHHHKKVMGRAFMAEFRAISGWRFANRGADLLAERAGTNYQVLRYEDLVSEPQRYLTELGEFLGRDLGGVIDLLLSGKLVSSNHQVAGNRMKLNTAVTLKPDTVWPEKLFGWQRALARLLAGRYLRRYDYL